MLCLSNSMINEIIDHSKQDAPDEVCGIFGGVFVDGKSGKDREVKKLYRMTNAERSPESFLMDPKEQFNVMKDMRNLGLEMVAIYHSHPATRSYPSEHDVRLAFYPEISYVIVSLQDKDNPIVNSFTIVDGVIAEEEIKILL